MFIESNKVGVEKKYLKLTVHFDLTKVNKRVWTVTIGVFYSIDSLVVIDNVATNDNSVNVHNCR